MIIVITLPNFFSGEAERITQLLTRGNVDFVHIRKPYSQPSQTAELIDQIPPELYPRLALHDHHELAQQYHLGGIHLNSRNPKPLDGWTGRISISCHTIEELAMCQKQNFSYMSLSPIFNSISKQGYNAAFSLQEIAEAHRQGIINNKVMALGGVRFSTINEVINMGFGGAMILGDAWK